MSGELLVLINAFATWYMVGVIWFVQLVHYPLMAHFDPSQFREACQRHQRQTSWVVGPAMLIESLSSGLLLFMHPYAVPTWLVWLGFGLIWPWLLATALWSIPCHDRLARHGWDASVHRRLVRTNWLRTAAWSVRGIVCFLATYQVVGA